MLSDYIEQIKSRLLPSHVISQVVKLKSKGGGEFLGVCPFHSEKTPSFTVSDIKKFYHCFGCGAHGDIFTFVMEAEKVDYKIALKQLAERAGVALHQGDVIVRSKEERKITDLCYAILKSIAEFYHEQLYAARGYDALAYFQRRGLKAETIVKYQLGYAPSDSKLLFQALMCNFSFPELKESGIFKNVIEERLYDPFHGRVIFPIQNQAGKVVAFGGRILGEGQPKYLNSSENPVFHKGEILYGLYTAQRSACKSGEIVVVEGYMDVLALANHEIYNVVAPLGIGFSMKQVARLWEIVSQPTICLDADIAGSRAVLKIAKESLKHITPLKSLKFVSLQGGKDIDEVISKNGLQYGKELLAHPIPLANFLFQTELKSVSRTIPESQAALKNRLIEYSQQITDPSLRASYKNYFLNLFFQSQQRHKVSAPNSQESLSQQMKLLMNQKNQHILMILRVLLERPELLEKPDIYDEFMRLESPSASVLDKIRTYILDTRDDFTKLQKEAHSECAELVKQVLGLKMRIGNSVGESTAILMRAFKVNSLHLLQEQIRDTEKELLAYPSEAALCRLSQLKAYEWQYKNELQVN